MRMAGDFATCMYHTGLDPFTGKEVCVATGLRDGKRQEALMPFFNSESDSMVREALFEAGRGDLIGSRCDCLIPAQPPRAAVRARVEKANESLGEGKYVHRIPKPEPGKGYRPGRKSAQRRQGK
jgi:Domain of unknown function (DUF3362)